MEETINQQENVSIESLPSPSPSLDPNKGNSEALDGVRETIDPLNTNNGLNSTHQDLSTNKHGYCSQSSEPELPDSSTKLIDPNRSLIDTAAPFQSVKAAVNMFGGNVDWKTQRALTKERNKNFELELEKAEQEVPLYLKQVEEAEDAKSRVLQELEMTKKQLEELKLELEKAQIEESQAQQDSELAQLRVKEIEQGISDEDSVAAKELVQVARNRYLEADNELKSLEAVLSTLRRECDQLIKEKDVAAKKAEEAVLASKEVEKTVDKLTIELISAKEAVESANASHLKAEEQRLDAVMEREQETHNWEKQMKQSQEKLHSLEEKLSVVNDLKLKLDSESTLLSSLKWELAAYVPTKLSQEAEIVQEEKQKLAQPETEEAVLTAAKNELEEVKASIQKAKDEVNCLRIAAYSLKSELEKETSSLASLKEKEKMSVMTISSLQANLEMNQDEQEEVHAKQKTSHEEMRDLPYELLDKTEEADQAKSKANSASQELIRATEELELAKTSASAMELRLQAVLKEIEAAKASEKLSLDAIKAVQESEQVSYEDVMTIHLEEYYALSKRANEAERFANEMVIAAVDLIKDAKKTESMSREKLEASYKEIKERKEALRDATEKAEKAIKGKLNMEQELREWRTENEQRRKANEATASSKGQSMSVRHYWKSFDDSRDINGSDPASIALRVNSTPNPNRCYSVSEVDASVTEERPRRKKSFFPRIIMFLARKRAQSLN
uniref:Weak chloroplast movement under blue light 1-like protein n=1 Tax=Dendrobium officinale TaxID=142615 RepID=A0A1S6YFQ6_DENOF|nr:weak chloroplast movement under blue light 1-like protein [Dendrobium officinale]